MANSVQVAQAASKATIADGGIAYVLPAFAPSTTPAATSWRAISSSTLTAFANALASSKPARAEVFSFVVRVRSRCRSSAAVAVARCECRA